MDGTSFGWRESTPTHSWWKRKIDMKRSLVLTALIAGATLGAITALTSLAVHLGAASPVITPEISLSTASGQG